MPTLAIVTKQATETTSNQELSTYTERLVAKRITQQKNVIIEPMQQIDYLLGTEDRRDRIRINDKTHKIMQKKVPRLQFIL